tara:strand:- start:10 stop:261 length:252 start_codon:yes stop_codon:yes gene_type:complete
MDIKQAIGILETHNRWRRGEDLEPMLSPRDIGIAIDIVVEHIKNNGVLDNVSISEAEVCLHCGSDAIINFGFAKKCSDCRKMI